MTKINAKSRNRRTIRKPRAMVSNLSETFLQYNGAPEEYEDLADYLPRGMVKAVRLG